MKVPVVVVLYALLSCWLWRNVHLKFAVNVSRLVYARDTQVLLKRNL